MKILIVEDEKLLADSLKTLLESKGFDVETVYDGISGAEYAELGVYDLLILDVMMPGMGGYAVARSVRARRCGVPILMLTARSSLEKRGKRILPGNGCGRGREAKTGSASKRRGAGSTGRHGKNVGR